VSRVTGKAVFAKRKPAADDRGRIGHQPGKLGSSWFISNVGKGDPGLRIRLHLHADVRQRAQTAGQPDAKVDW